jgi:4-oxalocrotonate tautomerase
MWHPHSNSSAGCRKLPSVLTVRPKRSTTRPNARIDLRRGKPTEYLKKVNDVVYESMTRLLGVPDGGRFQITTEHPLQGINASEDYNGVERTEDCIIPQVTVHEGKAAEMKKAFYKGVCEGPCGRRLKTARYLHQHTSSIERQVVNRQRDVPRCRRSRPGRSAREKNRKRADDSLTEMTQNFLSVLSVPPGAF